MGWNKGRLYSGHIFVSHTTQTPLLHHKSDHTLLSVVLCHCRCFHPAVELLGETWNQYVNQSIIIYDVSGMYAESASHPGSTPNMQWPRFSAV